MWLRPNTWESFLSAHILLYPTPTAANSVFPVFKMTPASTPPHPQHLHCYHPWSVSLPPPLPHVIPLPQTQWVLMFSDGPYRGPWGCTCLHHLSNLAIKPCTRTSAHTHTYNLTSSLPLPHSGHQQALHLPSRSLCTFSSHRLLRPSHRYLHSCVPPFPLARTQASPCQGGNTTYPICQRSLTLHPHETDPRRDVLFTRH